MIQNSWNERTCALHSLRRPDLSRPWYAYARELIDGHWGEGKRGLPALDVGCGMGEFMIFLRDRGFNVEGVDGNEEQMRAVQGQGFKGKVVDLEEGLPFPDRVFSLVSCLETIEHIARAEGLLGEIHRVLRPGGVLLLSTPNFAYFQNRIRSLLGGRPYNEGIHLRYFNRKTLLSLLSRACFKVIGQNSYGPIPLLSTFAIRALRRNPPLWHLMGRLESLLAYDFIYLAAKV